MNVKTGTVLYLLLINILALSASERAVMIGRVYEKDTTEIMYIQKEYITEYPGGRKREHVYYRTDGSKAAHETVIIQTGRITYYESSIYDFNIKGIIIRDNDEMIIRVEEKDKVREKRMKWNDQFVPGPLLYTFISENLENIQKNDVVFYLPLFERQTLIPFKLTAGTANRDETVVQMKLKNFLLGMLIEPVDFILESPGGPVREIHGPTILPAPDGRGSKDRTDASIFYTYSDSGQENIPTLTLRP